MPNVQQTKFNKGAYIAFGFIAAMIGVTFLKIDFRIKIAADVALLLIFLFIRRGYLYFYRAAVAYKKDDEQKIWSNFERALKAGVDFDRKVQIGSLYIQRGDAKRGIEVLESVMNSPKAGPFGPKAAIICSMGYWRQGEKDKAIKTLEDLSESGIRDDNLSINLETYYLETGNLKAAKKAISDGRKNNTENNGLMDNRGWYDIRMGHWQKAKELYDELINDRNAKFPEAYLHGAQVSIHYGDIEEAVDRLGWSLSKSFSKTCMLSKDYISHLLLGLENPATRDAFAKAMDDNCDDVSCGRVFSGYDKAVEFDASAADVIAPKEKKKVSKPSSEETLNTDVDDDEREPNTDLDDDDVEYAAAMGVTEAPEDESSPDTSVDDDDDRVPNTDLTDEDK
jgi:tetratricopeptide (TPR) repeat protein